MEIKDIEKVVDQTDSLLDKIKKVFKKHWLILIFIGLCYIGYLSFNSNSDEEEVDSDINDSLQVEDSI